MRQFYAMRMLLVVALALAGCKQEPALTETGEINLARCKVPAGIMQEAAEKMKCANAGHAAGPDASAMVAGGRGAPGNGQCFGIGRRWDESREGAGRNIRCLGDPDGYRSARRTGWG